MPQQPRHALIPPDAKNALCQAVGDGNWYDQPDALMPFNQEWRGYFRGQAGLVLLPRTTATVAQLVKICAAHRVSIVPQGGNTGLVGGAVAETHQVILSLNHLNKLRHIDGVAGAMIVEAGATLAEAQSYAAAADRLFPLHLASQSRCQIGGNLSTNAGGIAVLKYGTMRDLTYGLEVVMPDGTVISQLSGLRKDNTGYDLRHIFIGAEGTLGIITAACLRLYPSIKQRIVAWVGLPDPTQAMALLTHLRHGFGTGGLGGLGDHLAAYEIINQQTLALVLQGQAHRRAPLTQPAAWHGLIMVESTLAADENAAQDTGLASYVQNLLLTALERGLITEAVLAANDRQRAEFFALREAASDAQKAAGASLKHDVSLPLAMIPEFLARAEILVQKTQPGTRIVAFGHFGDGNFHYNLSQPPDLEAAAFLARRAAISHDIHRLVVDLGGSISAEHGIGILRRQDFLEFTPPAEIAVMQKIKHSLDPLGIMNPGKILPG
ncbi:MAG: FAD-binding oxidoreductase [Alphaproteobacteria bacterium]|nr:FAD-binding oxidoreductase [Alphaproteobacteria bacterium]